MTAAERSALRTALLLADDLTASVDMVNRTTGETLEQEGRLTDLLRFWVSKTAVRFRAASKEDLPTL